MSRPEREHTRATGRLAPTLPAPLQRIVLAGFMGSGKTTVGRLLAARLGWSFTDLDAAIEARESRAVAEIFAQAGEPHFRACEIDTLRELLLAHHAVIALGGGAPGSAPVRELLRSHPGTAVVHLDAPFPVLYDRCSAQRLDTSAAVRPLLGDPASASARYALRRPLYLELAHHTAPADLPTPEAVADSIVAALAPSIQA